MSYDPLKKLKKELLDMNNDKNPSENFSIGPYNDDLMHWRGSIIGPIDSAYEGGIFEMEIRFTEKYPFVPPEVKFITKIYHPNIDDEGNICLDILKKEWNPILTISKVMISICSLIIEPNADDPLVPEIAYELKNNKKEYLRKAKLHTLTYA